MSFLNKLGDALFEKQEVFPYTSSLSNLDTENILNNQIPIEVNVQMEGLLTISQIYEQNAKSDVSKTIYKIEELKNALPKELSDVMKKSTVENTLPIIQLTKEEVITDGNERIDILNAVLNKITEETLSIIDKHDSEIQSLEEQINNLKNQTLERQKLQEEQSLTIKNEVQKIKEILTFIGG